MTPRAGGCLAYGVYHCDMLISWGSRGSLVLVSCLAALVMSCGGDGNSPTSPTSPPAPPASPPVPAVLHDTMTPAVFTPQVFPYSESWTRVPFGSFFTIDDFVSPLTTTVRSLRWLGVYCESEPNGRGRLPTQLASAFLIAFYADQQGFPSFPSPLLSASSISSGTYTPSQAGEHFVRSVDLPCDASTPAAVYEYSLTLSDPLPVKAGTRYWLAIQAMMTHTNVPSCGYIDCVHWGWYRTATVDNGYGFNPYFHGTVPFDMAFQVSE